MIYLDGLNPFRKKIILNQRGKPFEKIPIEYDWNDRGNFTRKYAHSVNTFALRSFFLDENVSEANLVLQELCRHYLSHETDLLEPHSFHWSGILYDRLWSFFGPNGRVSANKIKEKTQSLMLEMMFAWAHKASHVLNWNTEPECIWTFPNSENHHAMGILTTWSFCGALKDSESFSERSFEGGGVAVEHYDAWIKYFKAYFRARSGKGQCVEIASKNYNAHTIMNWYNLHDFSEDDELRELAACFLDLYWATWAEEQIDLVRGGGKTRVYQGPASKTGGGGAIARMAAMHLETGSHFQFGRGDAFSVDDHLDSSDWAVVTSTYQMPNLVKRLASETEDRGEYEVIQRCMGLQEPGYKRVPDPPIVHFGLNRFRVDYGGFLRYSYCTPDYVMGTLMVEPRPLDDWVGCATQNRWQGVIFKGNQDAAIVPECLAIDAHLNALNHPNTMNQHWSVQRRSTLITQKLKTGLFSERTGDSRVWISASGLSEPLENKGWIYVEAASAFAALKVVDGEMIWDSVEESGRWLKCCEDLSPIIIEVGRKKDYATIEIFQESIESLELKFENSILMYSALSGDSFRFYADFSSMPEVNGEVVNMSPDKGYDSPFVKSDWDSGIVNIAYGDESKTLNFNT